VLLFALPEEPRRAAGVLRRFKLFVELPNPLFRLSQRSAVFLDELGGGALRRFVAAERRPFSLNLFTQAVREQDRVRGRLRKPGPSLRLALELRSAAFGRV